MICSSFPSRVVFPHKARLCDSFWFRSRCTPTNPLTLHKATRHQPTQKRRRASLSCPPDPNPPLNPQATQALRLKSKFAINHTQLCSGRTAPHRRYASRFAGLPPVVSERKIPERFSGPVFSKHVTQFHVAQFHVGQLTELNILLLATFNDHPQAKRESRSGGPTG